MVMRVTNMSLEAYMQKHILDPLGMKCITFFPKQNPEIMARLMDMSQRDCGITKLGTAEDSNAKVVYTDETVWDIDSVACHGGAGLHGSPVEYQKMLHSICADDGKLLKSETIAEMFKPQLTDAARARIQELMSIPEMNQTYGGMQKGVRYDWGIGGMMNLDAFPGRSAGTLSWGGMPNLHWWCDRNAGMSGIIGCQIFPPGDVQIRELLKAWTKDLYLKAGLKEKAEM